MKQTPFKHIKTVDFGTDEIIVRRLMLQMSNLTNPFGNKKDLCEKMLSIYFNEIARKLLECRRIEIEISQYVNEIFEEYKNNGIESFSKNGTLFTPCKPNLESIAANYLYTFKQILKAQVKFLNMFYPTKIQEARWDKVKNYLVLNGYKDKRLFKCIDCHYPWIEKVCRFRNDLEHGNSEDPFVISDFEIIGQSISKPKWGHIKQGLIEIDESCRSLINNMIHFGEEIFAICLAEFVLSDSFILLEKRIPASHESKEMRFSISLNPKLLQKISGA
jgi:hypothetical protein